MKIIICWHEQKDKNTVNITIQVNESVKCLLRERKEKNEKNCMMKGMQLYGF